MLFRFSALLSALLWGIAFFPQERPEALRSELKTITDLIRAEPPEVALRRVDSLMNTEQVSSDALWRFHMLAMRGHALRQMGRSNDAIVAYVKSYQLSDSLDDARGKVDAQLAIAAVHMDLNDLERAGRELRSALSLSERHGTPHADRILLVMGARASMMEQNDSALYWYGRALQIAEAKRDSFLMADLHYNMGVVHNQLGQFGPAEEELKAGLRSIPHIGYALLEGTTRESLAYLYIRTGKYDQAGPLLDSARTIALELSNGELLTTVLENRVELYEATGRSNEAIASLKELIMVKDSLAHVVREEELADAQTRFGVSKLEKELELTKAEAEVNALRAQRVWIAWGALVIIAVLAAVLIFMFHRQARLEQKTAQLLERDRERLMEENELLHQENLMARFETLKSQVDPHFLFNAMNTLYTLVESEPNKAREFIASFSALYRQVLNSRERTIVPIQEELQLARHYVFLQRIRFGNNLTVDIDIPAEALSGYLPPFTLQMLLENAIKHNVISAAKPLHISVTAQDGRLIVRNDLRPRGSVSEGTGTGLENIRRRYAMLGATDPDFRINDAYYTATVPILTERP
jgi:tetratricopeptide (TPR) repeat protein